MLVLWAALDKLGHWMHWSTLYLPRGKLNTDIFNPLTVLIRGWGGESMTSTHKLPLPFSPGKLDCGEPIRASELARQMLVLWAVLAKILSSFIVIFWMNRLIKSFESILGFESIFNIWNSSCLNALARSSSKKINYGNKCVISDFRWMISILY